MRILSTILTAFILFGCAARGQQTYHELEIIPNSSGTAGEVRLVETNGWTSGTGTNYVGFKPPASITSNVVWTLPNADGSSGTCLSTNGSTVLSWVSCSGGGSSLPVVDTTSIVEGSVDATKEIRFEVDGLTTGTVRVLTPQDANYTLAGTNIAQTFTATQTMQSIAAAADSTYDIGTNTVRFDDAYVDRIVVTDEVEFGNYQIQYVSASNELQFETTGGAQIFVLDGATSRIEPHWDIIPAVHSAYDLGSSGLSFEDAFLDGTLTTRNITANSGTISGNSTYSRGITFTTGGTYDVGSTSARADDGYFAGVVDTGTLVVDSTSSFLGLATFFAGIDLDSGQEIQIGTAPPLTTGTYSSATIMETDALAISSSGSFYLRSYSGADVNCSGVSDGWIGYRTDTNELQICDGGALVTK